ncbi:MAG TPA: hypothetical protein VF681_12925 [Abditibacteriaceae bacterium]|jgi:hypothetical protein
MQTAENRPSNLPAAFIVAASLLASSLIIANRPLSAGQHSMPAASNGSSQQPPIPQESAREQFRSQMLAVLQSRPFTKNKKTYKLVDVKVTQVVYLAKEDVFSIEYDRIWQPAMPSGGPRIGYAILRNDGYGHYYGEGTARNTPITIK